MARLPTIVLLSLFITASMATGTLADETQLGPGHPPGAFSVGAGYERYSAEWIGSNRRAIRDAFQNRVFLQISHRFAPRLRIGARLGAADLSAPDLDNIDFRNHVDYGLSPFGSVHLNWTPLGAQPGTMGGALEIHFEASAFGTYTADRIEGSLDDGFGEPVGYEAWPEVSSMWEGRIGILLAIQNGTSCFGCGFMFLQSGAETRTHIKTRWGEGTETDYFRSHNNIGMVGAWRFSPGADLVLDTKVAWTGPALLFEVSLGRVLARRGCAEDS